MSELDKIAKGKKDVKKGLTRAEALKLFSSLGLNVKVVKKR